ncbi:hypothetical protein [Sphingosinithalassobacter portus]|uniref:hypothetical protein n=1 Tax=Stakelama portus TaxID=2676234 RepID=UPI0011AB5775|nr:hypothetical protein [Sphingosinithalassobacter portus]
MRGPIAAALLTLSLTNCALPERAVPVMPDPAQLSAGCPDAFPKLTGLPPLARFTLAADVIGTRDDGTRALLPAGTEVALYSNVLDRDEVTALFIVRGARGAWAGCRSGVLYGLDWIRNMEAPP